jgi:4-hydroxy-tetrahydrodipicolinate synthase
MNSQLGVVLTAMVTPFGARGELDLNEAGRLARWLVDRGNDGLIVAGSTGEGQTLEPAERVALYSAVKKAVGSDAFVIANSGTNATRESVRKPTQSGMLGHFGAIAEATHLPVVIYNIPGRTAANMLPETLLELARRHANIVGVKESSGDLKQIGMILRDRAEGFIVWSGDDHLFLPCLALGADGVVGVASHLCSREYRAMLDAYRNGHVAEAAQIHASLLPLIDALFATTSPIPVKWAMGQLGFNVGSCRLPLDEIPQSVADRLRPFLAAYASPAVETQ